jgi:uncharacterized ferritin-like protein (DUF455 family)
MELREWALRILEANTLEGKLFCPQEWTDNQPGSAVRITEPTRPPGMELRKRPKKEKLPAFHELGDPLKRAICLHRFAGHELLAIELMAFALLAFPEAPPLFRKGIVVTLKDEQEHLALYEKRLNELGVAFGDFPQYRHFWVHTKFMHDPIHYVSTVNLTLEMANLDFAPHYGKTFEQFGDANSSALMAKILEDEIRHVNFGWRWLQRFKEEHLNAWEAWTLSQSEFLNPKRARGFEFNSSARLEAGIAPDWLELLKNY